MPTVIAGDWMSRKQPFWLFLTAVFLLSSLLLLNRPALPVSWPTTLTAEQAAATAVNQIEPLGDGLRLTHPRHIADFDGDGLTFTPRSGGPVWRWQLAYVGTESGELTAVSATTPQTKALNTITYDRGVVIEQYVARSGSVEQQFVLPQRLPLAGSDLVIRGAVESGGQFETTAAGWAWRNISGVVSLGDVTVLDARGEQLPAEMRVTAVSTEIVVNGRWLETAAYPVLIDPEIGSNDFQISKMGADYEFDAEFPAVAYNTTNKEFFVVWEGDTETQVLSSGETEIFGRRLDGITGAPIGGMVRISNVGPDGASSNDAGQADVVYNSISNEYFVVWSGDGNNGEFEISGQRVAANGQQIGDDILLSDMGPDADVNFDAEAPAVAFNSKNNEYLVVWMGDDIVDGEEEIYGQRVAANGSEIGGDVRLSDMGPDGDLEYGAAEPDVAFNSTNGEYLVVWRGDDNTVPHVAGENEIFAQRVSGTTGAEVGANDFAISDMGTEGSSSYDAFLPRIAYNAQNNEFFVVWVADDKNGTQVNDEVEVFGQRINGATGLEVGTNDMRLSNMGPDGNVNFEAFAPDVAYDAGNNEYLVVWYGNTQAAGLNDAELEVYGQRVNAANGSEIGGDFRLSDMGQDGDIAYAALSPAVAYGGGQYLTVWYGDEFGEGYLDDEFEIFGQMVDAETGAEIGVNDRRLTRMGPAGYPDAAAFTPDVAFNSKNNEFFVVWAGSDNSGDLRIGEDEIFGQRISAASGALLGGLIRLSDMGPNGAKSYDAETPAIAYNPTNNQYFVVWAGDDDNNFLADEEFEIYGQRVNAQNGLELGSDIRLSDMGPDSSPEYDALLPDVAYNSVNNEYLVVWVGDDDTAPLVNEEFEIFGQRVTATGTQIGTDFRLSDMGPNGDIAFKADEPAVSYSSVANEYFVVWAGDDNVVPLVDGENEIFGQRVNGATGQEVGNNDMRLSDMGPDGSGSYDAEAPDVTYNTNTNEYLVVWSSEDDQDGMVKGEIEIFGQRLNASTGQPVGTNDFRISHMAQDGNVLYGGFAPKIAYSNKVKEYFVVWHGDNNIAGLVDEEFEIYGQRLDSSGAAVEARVQLSDMGTNGDVAHIALDPAVAFASTTGEFLVVWSGDDDTGEEAFNGFEIFGQRFGASRSVFLPLVMKK